VRIAQVSPLYESVPPQRYGGTERVVSYLSEALVQQGHDVTLFAAGDSVTAARLVPMCPRSLRTSETCVDQLAHHVRMVEQVLSRQAEFDVIHWHIDYLHFLASRRERCPRLTTLHGRLDLPELPALYDEFPNEPVVSISDAQRIPLPNAGWLETIYHGLPQDLYRPGLGVGGYFAFVGRISPEKRVDRAIAIAVELGVPLRIAAKVDRVDKAYFHEAIEPLLAHPLVEWLGEVDDRDKGELLRNARALLFPIDWPEPFGLVMIESMACGTPVVAFRRGSVPEVVEDGVSGLIVDTEEGALEAARRVSELDRRAVRAAFEARFTAPTMARRYVATYERVLSHRPSRLVA
jgi:glycosyltransferase involved in cell wall biosynthesis